MPTTKTSSAAGVRRSSDNALVEPRVDSMPLATTESPRSQPPRSALKLSRGKRASRVRRSAARIKAKLRHSALTGAPLWLSRGALAQPTAQRVPVSLQRTIVLPDMPDALDGLKITHLSDLHIGKLTTPEHLPGILAACQNLQGDLIAVTGDFIDLSQGVLDPVIDALKQLQAPLGVYLVPGNHDYLENGPKLVRRFRNAQLNLMVNKAATIQYHDHSITIAGVDYAHQRIQRAALVRQTMSNVLHHGRSDLTILLAHHPDAFDEACKYGVDMTLSGHTHGGQLVLKHTHGKRGSIGLGAMAFKYPRGLYQRGNRHLHVTSGVGSWFPLRVQCPSEIVSLTLRSDGHQE